jgi:hypothetical protein
MGHVLFVGFATHRCATMKIRLYFKKLLFMQMIYEKEKKEKKKGGVFTILVVFYNIMPKGTPAQWSFPTQCQREH